MSFENELRERLRDSASHVHADDDLFERAEQLHQRHVRRVQVGGALGAMAVLALGVVAGPWLADRFDTSPAPIIGEEETPSDGETTGPGAAVVIPPLLDTWSVLDELGVPTAGIVNREAYRAETAGEEQVFVLRYDQVAERPYAVSLATPDGITDLVTAGPGETIDLHGAMELDGTWYAIVSVTRASGAEAFLVTPTGDRAPRTLQVEGPDVRFHDVSPMLLDEATDALDLPLMPTYARGDGPLQMQPTPTSETSTDLRPQDAICRNCELLAVAGWDRHVALVDRAGDGTTTLKLVDAVSGDVLAEHLYEAPALRIVGGPQGFLIGAGPAAGWLFLGLDGRLVEAPEGGFLTFAKDPFTADLPQAVGPEPTPGWAPVAGSPIDGGWYEGVWTGEEAFVFGTAPGTDGAMGEVSVHAHRPADGRWRTIEAPAIPSPFISEAIWTGREVVLLGGDPVDDETGDAGGPPTVEGWAYDPTADTWRRLPVAPLEPRTDHTATWTGTELIVWGGMSTVWDEDTGTYRVTPHADGAAWDPDTNTWRRIADAPLSPRAAHGAVWNGRRLVVFGGGEASDFEGEFAFTRAAPGAAAYDPSTDSWATIAAPGEIGALAAYDWTGDRIVYWTGHLGRETNGSWFDPGRTWDPVTGDSQPIPAPPFDTRREYSVDSAWVDGLGWLVWGGGCGEGCNQAFRDGAILARDGASWTPLVPPRGTVGYGAQGIWIGDRLLTVGGDAEGWNHSPGGTADTAPLTWTPPDR